MALTETLDVAFQTVRRWCCDSIEARVRLAISLTLAITLVTVTAIALEFGRRHELQRAESVIQSEAELAASRFALELHRLWEEAAQIATAPIIGNALVDSFGRDTYLRDFLRFGSLASAHGLTLALCDFRGSTIGGSSGDADRLCRVPPKLDGAQDAEYDFGAIGSGGAALTRHETGTELHALTLFYPVVFPGTGLPEGMLIVSGSFGRIFGHDTPPNSAFGTWTSLESGDVILYGRGAVESAAPMTRVAPLPYHRHFADLDLRARASIDRSLLFEPALKLAGLVLMLGGAGLAFAVLAANRLAGMITRPIAELADFAARVSGDISLPMEHRGSSAASELRKLDSAIGSMVSALRAHSKELESRVADRTNALHRVEHRLARILESVTEIVFSTSINGRRLLYVSPSFESVTGFGIDVLKRDPAFWTTRMSLRHRHAVRRMYDTVMRDGRAQGEVCLRGADDRRIWLEVRLHIVDGQGEEAARLDGFAADITERKLASLAWRERHFRLNAVSDLSPDGLLDFDDRGMLRYVNPAACTMLRSRPADMVGLGLVEIDERFARLSASGSVPPSLLGLVQAARDAGPAGIARDRIQLVAGAGAFIDRGVRMLTGRSGGAIVYMRDVTHEIEVDRMKSEFLATAAHELRTPLASVYGLSELLSRREFNPEQRRDLVERLHRQSARLNELVSDLLDIARLESRGRSGIDLRLIDLKALAIEAASSFAVPGDVRKIAIDAAPGSVEVLGDPSRLRQVIDNLLSNAFKYSAPGSPISIGAGTAVRGETESAFLFVRDRGIGMSEEVRQHAFDRFYRADASGLRTGAGLGLALVKDIVDLHGGEVVIDSTLGSGTRVTVWLRTNPGRPMERSVAGAATERVDP